MSIEAQLDRLNANLESLVGAIAANTSVAASIANAGAAGAPVPGSAPAEKPTRTRRTREEIAADAAKAAAEETKPEVAPAAETSQSEEDPFGDSATGVAEPTATLDDVRNAGVALKDVVGLDKARAFIATFGVESIKDLPPAKYTEFVTKATAEAKKNAI